MRLIVVATVASFVGSFVGGRLIHKVTLRVVQWMVSMLLVVVGVGLIAGLV